MPTFYFFATEFFFMGPNAKIMMLIDPRLHCHLFLYAMYMSFCENHPLFYFKILQLKKDSIQNKKQITVDLSFFADKPAKMDSVSKKFREAKAESN